MPSDAVAEEVGAGPDPVRDHRRVVVVAGGEMPRPHPVVRLVPEEAGVVGDDEADDGERGDQQRRCRARSSPTTAARSLGRRRRGVTSSGWAITGSGAGRIHRRGRARRQGFSAIPASAKHNPGLSLAPAWGRIREKPPCSVSRLCLGVAPRRRGAGRGRRTPAAQARSSRSSSIRRARPSSGRPPSTCPPAHVVVIDDLPVGIEADSLKVDGSADRRDRHRLGRDALRARPTRSTDPEREALLDRIQGDRGPARRDRRPDRRARRAPALPRAADRGDAGGLRRGACGRRRRHRAVDRGRGDHRRRPGRGRRSDARGALRAARAQRDARRAPEGTRRTAGAAATTSRSGSRWRPTRRRRARCRSATARRRRAGCRPTTRSFRPARPAASRRSRSSAAPKSPRRPARTGPTSR